VTSFPGQSLQKAQNQEEAGAAPSWDTHDLNNTVLLHLEPLEYLVFARGPLDPGQKRLGRLTEFGASEYLHFENLDWMSGDQERKLG